EVGSACSCACVSVAFVVLARRCSWSAALSSPCALPAHQFAAHRRAALRRRVPEAAAIPPGALGSEWCRTMSRGVIARESELGSQPPDQRAVSLALLDILDALARPTPVVVAVDDVQWLDASSAAVLEFALRRLRSEPVGFLASARTGAQTRLAIEEVIADERVERLTLGPLGVGAAFRLVSDRVGVTLSRPELARLHELADGNPFYLLELGRELERSGARPTAGQPWPVPRDLTELLAGRLGRLPGWTRELLLAIAASPRPTVEVLEAALADEGRVHEGLERAADSGVLELDGSLVRFVHPLLASVCYQAAPLWRRRAVHRLLAGAVSEPEERARHLALAAQGPDAAVASDLDRAGARAAMRGATAAAGELYELAADATPSESAARQRAR